MMETSLLFPTDVNNLLSFEEDPFCMNRFLALLIGLICCFYCITATAQLRQYRFKHINVDQGLTHNEVISFYKDRKGFLWIGTTAGLNRYDGYTVRSFLNDVRDSLSLSDNVVTSIGGLPDGKIGVITPSGLNIYNPATENFVHQLNGFLQSIQYSRRSPSWDYRRQAEQLLVHS